MTTRHDGVAIANLLASYGQLCDDERFDEFQALFADDAVMLVGGDEIRGARAIRTFVEDHQRAGMQGKHLIGNLRMDLGDDTAAVTSDFFFFRWGEGGMRVSRSGRYVDRLRRFGAEWRFTRHEVTFTPRPGADRPVGIIAG